jgi:hypothetical protein
MYHYDFYYGLCWRFNSGKALKGNDSRIRTSGQVGWKHGLQLELYTGNAHLQEKFAMARGFRVFVFNKSNQFPVGLDIGVDVGTGRTTNIGIKRTFTNRLSSPYSNCLSDDVTQIDWNQNEVLQFMYDNFVQDQSYLSGGFWRYAGNWTWNWTVSYSQSICVKLCFQKYLFQTCGRFKRSINNQSYVIFIIIFVQGCYDVTLPRTPAVADRYIKNACVKVDQIECVRATEDVFYDDRGLVGDCYAKCPTECTEIKYDLTMSSGSFPTEWYASVLTNNSNFNEVINLYFAFKNVSFINYTNNLSELKNSIARLNVYYEDLRYVEIVDNAAMNVVTLLGTLGGNMGLFLGIKFSFLSHVALFLSFFFTKM